MARGKGGTASVPLAAPDPLDRGRAVALAVRRPRGSAPVLILGGVAALVLLVHALSQAPQSEFELPFVPVWIVAALVGLTARREGAARAVLTRRAEPTGPTITAVPRLELIPPGEFARVAAGGDPDARLALLADMCRFNALTAVKRAGSGHLGSTFSSLDLVVHLLWEELNVAEVGLRLAGSRRVLLLQGPRRPRVSTRRSTGWASISTERLLRLRRLGGLDGHPDVGVPGIEANSGLARDGDLEGPRDRLGEAPPRPGRPGGRDDG